MTDSPPRHSYAVYAITKHGIAIAERLMAELPDADLFVSEKLFGQTRHPQAKPMPLPMGPLLRDTFTAYDCHLFVISVGAVVRMVAPLLQNKKVDPAIVCVDDAARYSICVLSGHVGRGNAFTERVAQALGAQAIITTASDVRGTLTVDILGRDLGWTLDDIDRHVTRGCAAVVNQTPVMLVQECGEPDFWPLDKSLPPGVRYTTSLDGVDPKAFEILLVASDRDVRASHPQHWDNAIIYRPKSLILGIGCDKDTPAALVERGVDTLLQRHGLAKASVKALATITQKAREPALLALSEKYEWPLHVFTPEVLDVVPGIENPSDTVKKYVGSRGVAEPACLQAAGADKLLVPKQVYTEPDAGRNMTLAVARIPFGKREVN